MAAILVKNHLDLTNITTAGAVTYTVAQLAGGLITRNPNGAGRADVVPTGTQLCTFLKKDGDTLACYLVNTAGGG